MSVQSEEQNSDTESYYKKKYEALLNEYQEFAYVVSHDLQSPVRQMTGFTEILLQEIDSEITDQLKCYSDMIKHVGQEASEALESLLEFSRLNTDEKNFISLDMAKIVETVLAQFEPKREKIGATVKVGNLPPAVADQTLVTRLYAYLLSNAFKFRSVKRTLEVEIGAVEKDGKTHYFIKDNGIGMSADKVESAFIMFRRLNSPDSYKGRGVGLTLAKKIVEIHQGDLWIETEPNVGTTVYFTFGLE